jgi:hypothetical protein
MGECSGAEEEEDDAIFIPAAARSEANDAGERPGPEVQREGNEEEEERVGSDCVEEIFAMMAQGRGYNEYADQTWRTHAAVWREWVTTQEKLTGDYNNSA